MHNVLLVECGMPVCSCRVILVAQEPRVNKDLLELREPRAKKRTSWSERIKGSKGLSWC